MNRSSNCLVIILFIISTSLQSQQVDKGLGQPVKRIIDSLDRAIQYDFFYKESWLLKKISFSPDQKTIPAVMDEITARLDLDYVIFDKKVVFIEGDLPSFAFATNDQPDIMYTFSGQVSDEESGEPVMGANILLQGTSSGTVTNENGFFQLEVPNKNITLGIQFVGYARLYKSFNIYQDTSYTFQLYTQPTHLREVVVMGIREDNNLTNVNPGKTQFSMLTAKSIPQLMGEVDLVKSISLLPGITTVGESSSGFSVRGGGADQNLILMDNAPLFNTSHLFGFYSAFNPDLVKNVTLYKAGIPSQFGGRLSSVMDIKLKEGDFRSIHGNGGLGIISSKLALEGPIIKDKFSFLLGGRASYSDWILGFFKDPDIANSNASFYDGNVKLSAHVGDKDRIYFSAYGSHDTFSLATDTTFSWTSTTGSLLWDHLFSEKLVGSISAVMSNYDYGIAGESLNKTFDWNAGISHRSGKANLAIYPTNNHRIDFGAEIIVEEIDPGSLVPGANSPFNEVSIEIERTRTFGMYLSDEFTINNIISVSAGMRANYYQYLGPKTVAVYEEGVPRDNTTISGFDFYSDGKVINDHISVSPRFSGRYLINKTSSIKLSYSRTFQYLYRLTNAITISPVDIWKASDPFLKPQVADQITLGLFKNLKVNQYETSAEVYYKNIDNIVDYKDGAELLLNPVIEADLLQGSGRAYGLELMMSKNTGRFTGWISYTFSRSERRFKGNTPEETINQGKYYPGYYDKPHDLSLVTSYRFTKRWSVSTNFVYNSGRPTTYPHSKYNYNDRILANFETRNSDRIPDYLRLDFSVTLDESHRINKIWHGSWTFSVINLLGRNNAYSVYFKAVQGRSPQPYKLTILGSPFPSISYNFKF